MSPFSTRTDEQLAPLRGVYAVVGCDGTGKTMLTQDLVDILCKSGPAKRCYLGLVSGEMGDKLKGLPFIGVRLENNLHRKVDRALDMEQKLPGTGTAFLMYLFSWWRLLLLWRVRRFSRRGVLVITDRYPQAEVPGFHYDGPGLTVGRTSNWLVRKLAEGEQKQYRWMAAQKPSLVIRLNIDEDTAQERKLDHDMEELRDKISVMPRLEFNGVKICDIDASVPYPQVLEAVLQEIQKARQAAA